MQDRKHFNSVVKSIVVRLKPPETRHKISAVIHVSRSAGQVPICHYSPCGKHHLYHCTGEENVHLYSFARLQFYFT